MFGCVIDNYGYTDQFVQQGGVFTLSVPAINEINHVSIFCFHSEELANIAFEISLINGPDELRIGFLTDFQPSFTFPAPKVPVKSTQTIIKLELCNYDNIFVETLHEITPEEEQMVELQAKRMIDNLNFSLAQKAVIYNNQSFLPLNALKKWKEQYIEYLYETK